MSETPSIRKRREAFGTLGKKGAAYYPSYTGPDRKRYAAPNSFRTITDARAWLSGQRAAIEAGEWTVRTHREVAGRFIPKRDQARPFETYVEAHIAGRRNRRGLPLAPKSLEEYRRLLNGALKPFHGIDITSITSDDVQSWWDDQLDGGKLTQASHAYDLARQALAGAVTERLIADQPFEIRGAASLRTGRKVRIPSDLEVELVLAAATLRWRSMFLCEAFGSLRYGELAALRRADVHRGSRIVEGKLVPELTLHIARGISRTKGEVHELGPKSEAGKRPVVLAELASRELDAWITDHVPDDPKALIWPALKRPDKQVAYRVYWRHWTDTVAAAGVTPFNPHALRHYGLTVYAQAGATLREIQARGGHSTVTAALRYQHAAEGRASDLANAAATSAATAAERERKKAELRAQLAALEAEDA